jgi:hypothetical protein
VEALPRVLEALPRVLSDREDRDVAITLHSLRYNHSLGITYDVTGRTEQTVYLTLSAIFLDEGNRSELSATGFDYVTYCGLVHGVGSSHLVVSF